MRKESERATTDQNEPCSAGSTGLLSMAKKQTTHANGGGSRRQPSIRNPQMPADTRSKRGYGAKSQATRERAVLALLSEKTITDAAKKAGVDDSTLRRWLSQDETFQADEYAAARTVAEIGIHQHDAETILQKLDEIESDQRRQQGR